MWILVSCLFIGLETKNVRARRGLRDRSVFLILRKEKVRSREEKELKWKEALCVSRGVGMRDRQSETDTQTEIKPRGSSFSHLSSLVFG